MNLSIGEIFEQAGELEGADQTAFLRSKWTPTLGILIQYAYEPIYQFDLPEGIPPYKPNDLDDQESNLYAEIRRLYVFLKPHAELAKHGGHVPEHKKQMLWIQLLENVSKKDAEVLVAVKEKRLPHGMTAERLRDVFPGILSSQAGDTFVETTVEENTEQPAIEEKKKPAPKKKPAAKRKTASRKPAAKKGATKKTTTRRKKTDA